MTLEEYESWFRGKYRKTSSALTAAAMIVADFLAVMISFGAGFFVVKIYFILLNDWGGINAKSFINYWPYLPIFVIIFWIMRLYPGVSLAPAEELRGFTIGSCLVHGGIIISRYIETDSWDSISAAFIFSAFFSAFFLMIFRDFIHFLFYKIPLKTIPVVIFGGGETGRIVVDRLLDSTRSGYDPILILDNDTSVGDEYRGIPIIHDIMAGPYIVSKTNIKMAIVAMPNLDQEEMTRMFNFSVSAFRYNVLIPDFVSISNIWMSIRDFDGILGLATSYKFKMWWNRWIKRIMDIVFVSLGGLLLFPFFLLIAALVRLSSSGPVLYKHKRIGQNAKTFYAYKFRSMFEDADKQLEKILAQNPELKKEWEASHKLKDDPRVTGIGKIMRRTSIDEFPQLLNILKGDMSLVGPRPVTDEEMEKYGENFNRIFSVKPGLTGLWQVSGRSDKDYSERISYDTYYLQSWSVWLDLWIIYKTPSAIFKGKGAY
ncbi:MAG: undecaprenyl-phosphate galactose phosphotransferase WbaP [Treponema sp.]|jgi:Undecaprenyl-phosphate galactose phosphotransferase WbaP|nr:undecaprenyl-phosphate galactose phosphotransferase WbaP [Treponema sp.]